MTDLPAGALLKAAFLAAILLLFGHAGATAAASETPLPSLPADAGHTQRVISYDDASGKNIVVLTESDVSTRTAPGSPDVRLASKRLHAYGYLSTPHGFDRQWSVTDHVKDCPEYTSIGVRHQADRLTVTDLDGDGMAEVWMSYELWCKGDVSPNTLKVIMVENGRKHAIRGETLVELPGTAPVGGLGVMDGHFRKAHPAMRSFAREYWKGASGGGMAR